MDKIQEAINLLEEITGVNYDVPLNWRFPGEKGQLYSLEEYLIEILERLRLKVKVCGNCNYSTERSDGLLHVNYCKIEAIKRKGRTHYPLYFNLTCRDIGLKKNYWIPKEIPKEKKEG